MSGQNLIIAVTQGTRSLHPCRIACGLEVSDMQAFTCVRVCVRVGACVGVGVDVCGTRSHNIVVA